MQIEVNNKTITAILAVIVVGGAVFFGVKAINENISREGGETRKDLADKADKKDIAGLTANLDAKITQLSAKMDEMNKQMATSNTTQTSTTPATATTATTTTSSTSAEEDTLKELENDVDDMKNTMQDGVDSLNDINDTLDDMSGAIEDAANNIGNNNINVNLINTKINLIKAQAKQAEGIINQYRQTINANENILTARQELFNANKLGDLQTITGAENKLVAALNTSGSNLSPAFAQQYFKQVPESFGKISGMDSALSGLKVGGAKFDFSKINFSKPSTDRNTGGSRSLDTTIRR